MNIDAARAGGGHHVLDVLLDPGDDVAVTRGLLARHDPGAGRIVVHPTATTRHPSVLGHDVLAALGAPITTLTAEHLGGAPAAWSAVRAWLHADHVEHLVVLRAHRLEVTAWATLLQLARHTHTRVLLVCHRPDIPARLRAVLPAGRYRVLSSLLQVLAAYSWPDPPRRAGRAVPADRLRRRRFGSDELDGPFPDPPRRWPTLPPHLPTGQVMHYRADVYRRGDPETFTRVDALYGQGLDTACEWQRHRQPPERYNPDTYRLLHGFLTELVHDSPSPQHSTALLRGAQAGFLLHGSWLALPNLAKLHGPGLTSVPVTAETVERIRAGIANPVLAAGVALALITGLAPTALRHLQLDALIPPGHVLAVPFKRFHSAEAWANYSPDIPDEGPALFHLPPVARPLLHAARTYLTTRNPNPRQRLFAGFSPIADAVEAAAARCGITLPQHPADVHTLWHLRARWVQLGEAFHPDPPDPHRPVGLSCYTAQPPAPDLAPAPPTAPPTRGPLRRRWSPLAGYPHVVPRLLHTWLEHGPSGAPPVVTHYNTLDEVPPASHHRDPVDIHLAVAIPPPAGTSGHTRYAVHPDITFALRWTDRPDHPYPKR